MTSLVVCGLLGALSSLGILFLPVGMTMLLFDLSRPPGLVYFAVFVGALMVARQPLRRFAWGWPVASAVMVLALWAAGKVFYAAELQSFPLALRTAASGVTFSLVSVFALVLRHIEVGPSRVRRGFSRALKRTTGEVHELVVRGYGVWKRTQAVVANNADNKKLSDDTVLELFSIAERWGEIDVDGDANRAAALTTRIDALDQRINDNKDEVVRAQYEQARDALREQLRQVKQIEVQRQRVLARLHNHLATIERLELARGTGLAAA